MNTPHSSPDIAIVGMSALFPGAKDLPTYWQNILNQVYAVKDAPEDWLTPYYDPNSQENDRIYNAKVGLIGDLAEFNPLEFGIMPSSVDGGEPVHFLSLKLAQAALADAGYLDRPFNREKTGIILGRGTYVNRAYNSLMQHGLGVDQTLDIIRQLLPNLDENLSQEIRLELKSHLPPFTAEMAPGLSPNVITGRIANRFDLHGSNYIVDGACTSSLIALQLAIDELREGKCDMMLTGGVQASTPPQINMIFCQLGAYSHSDIQPFSRQADGTILSEGLGILVLKRLADAEKDGDRIYAVIKGVGISSDGKGLGLLAPRLEGEVLAVERAYQESGLSPQSLSLIEAHGTGIPLGDYTEIQSLTQVFGQRKGKLPNCAIGSVKSMIGHCLPAAGAASLIKTALALYHKVLPPTLCEEINPELNLEKTRFYLNTETRPWIHPSNTPRRAGVNAFGFGGINGHAILEEYTKAEDSTRKSLDYQWPTELIVISASEKSILLEKITKVLNFLRQDFPISLANLAYTLSQEKVERYRLAIIADHLADLSEKLEKVASKLDKSSPNKLQSRNGIYYAVDSQLATVDRTAFLFPGEGSQYPNMLKDLCLHFPQVRGWFDFLDQTFGEQREIAPSYFIFPPVSGLTEEQRQWANQQLFNMDLASETVVISSLALYDLLKALGVNPKVMVGHSSGENAALIASGIIKIDSRENFGQKMRYLNQIYRDLAEQDRIPKGVLLAVGAVHSDLITQLIETSQGQLHLAMNNCPNQRILFGSGEAIEKAQQQIQQAGGIANLLPFDRAYHTPLFEEVSQAFRAFYDVLEVGKAETSLISCITMQPFSDNPEEIRSLATQQWSSQVRFRETIESLYEQGIRTFIEVGPNSNLTGFVKDILGKKEYLALSSNIERGADLTQLQHLLANLVVNGATIDLSVLYQSRPLNTLDLDNFGLDKDHDKSRHLLNLRMPIMKLSSELVEKIQQQFPQPQSSSPFPVTTQNLSENSFPSSPLAESNPTFVSSENLSFIGETTPTESNNLVTNSHKFKPNRIEISEVDSVTLLHEHFNLMQDFLNSQGRIAQAIFCDSEQESEKAFALSSPPSLIDKWPLLGQVIEHNQNYLRCERCFTFASDPFLYDHTIGGTLSQYNPNLQPLAVIPFTMSMEMMAEAACYLVGEGKKVVEMEDLRGYRWLALDQAELLLGIEARLLPSQDASLSLVQVRLYQLNQGHTIEKILVFEGMVKLQEEWTKPPEPLPFYLEDPKASRWSNDQLYKSGMFHGPRFQGVKQINCWGKQGIEAYLEVISIDDFFSFSQSPSFQIDAGLLDAAGQLVAYWIAEQSNMDFHAFPFRIAKFQQYQTSLLPNHFILCRGTVNFISEDQLIAHFDLFDQSGQLIARLEGWQDIFLQVPSAYRQCRCFPQTAYLSQPVPSGETATKQRYIAPFPSGFWQESGQILQRILAHLMLNEQERNLWYNLPPEQRTKSLLEVIVVKDLVRQWMKENYQLTLAPVDVQVKIVSPKSIQIFCPAFDIPTSVPEISIRYEGEMVSSVWETMQ